MQFKNSLDQKVTKLSHLQKLKMLVHYFIKHGRTKRVANEQFGTEIIYRQHFVTRSLQLKNKKLNLIKVRTWTQELILISRRLSIMQHKLHLSLTKN